MDKSITAEGMREEAWSTLEALAREGARKLLQQALENEVAVYIEAHASKRDENGRRLAVRNGTMPERSILTGLGPMAIRQPRVDDRKLKEQGEAERFSSQILPRYLRRVPSVDNLIPVLYLKPIFYSLWISEKAKLLYGKDFILASGRIVVPINRN